MPAPSQPLPTVGFPNSTEDPRLRAALLELQQILTQSLVGLDGDNLSTALAQRLGLSDSLATRRGKSIIAATESRSNTAYGLMPTPDRVQNIVLPTDGLIFVSYQATWQQSAASSGFAQLFLGANPVVLASNSFAAPQISNVGMGPPINVDSSLSTYSAGLQGVGGSGQSPAYTGDLTTGQVQGIGSSDYAGGPVAIFAAAGTYDISVQFKAFSGSVTVKNRKMWVWTMAF